MTAVALALVGLAVAQVVVGVLGLARDWWRRRQWDDEDWED